MEKIQEKTNNFETLTKETIGKELLEHISQLEEEKDEKIEERKKILENS